MHLKKIKLLAYSKLCKPIFEYASEVWDPSSKQLEQQIEAVQRKAVRFIKNLKGRRDSVTENLKLLNMKSIKGISLFHSVLEHEELFPTLISTLDTLKPLHDIDTRGANNFNSLTCNTNTFLHSFSIRITRELRTGNIIVYQ